MNHGHLPDSVTQTRMPETTHHGIWLVSVLGQGLPNRTHSLWTTCIVTSQIQAVEWIYTWWILVCFSFAPTPKPSHIPPPKVFSSTM